MIRIATDTGGTFTDLALVLEDGMGRMFKAPSTPEDPVLGVLDALRVAAAELGTDAAGLLSRTGTFIHATTWATNALLEARTARTALLVTAGHPDILTLREGGRDRPFDFRRAYPEPYVPRALTFEVPERIDRDGRVVTPLDPDAVARIVERLRREAVEAAAVCLLWSPVNPAHELAVGEAIAAALPGVPVTLSYRLNPVLREYRRGIAAAIDASLKPLMSGYLWRLGSSLREAGFGGELVLVTSNGSVLDAETVAAAPIHLVASGPAMAPIAGRWQGTNDSIGETLVVTDTGGTTYDISLVHDGWIPRTKEKWLGTPYLSDITGFPSVDVRSSGAGGGSIAWVDDGGLLRLGPRSAGAVPGPACYGKGGVRPTFTDACVALGIIRPEHFLGGRMRLDADAAERAISEHVGRPLGLGIEAAAAAIFELATEQMARAVEDITLHQGVDPRAAVLVAGGGAGGMNAAAVARRLRCRGVLVPGSAAVLSAAGALVSDISMDFGAPLATTSRSFDFAGVNARLETLAGEADAFLDRVAPRGATGPARSVAFFFEARYPNQVWDIEVPLRGGRFASEADVADFVADFHATHERMFAVSDPGSAVQVVACRCRASSAAASAGRFDGGAGDGAAFAAHVAPIHWPGAGRRATTVCHLDGLGAGETVAGPAVIINAITTIAVEPGMEARRLASGSLLIAAEASGGRALRHWLSEVADA